MLFLAFAFPSSSSKTHPSNLLLLQNAEFGIAVCAYSADGIDLGSAQEQGDVERSFSSSLPLLVLFSRTGS